MFIIHVIMDNQRPTSVAPVNTAVPFGMTVAVIDFDDWEIPVNVLPAKCHG